MIASNCIGGKLGDAFGAGYLSPTAGLWFEPADFLAFVEDLERNLRTPLTEDVPASRASGYPVGAVNGLRIYFMHYHSFAEAHEKWTRRCARVNLSRLLLCFTDRDGATEEHLARFDRLSVGARIAFVARPMPHLRSAVHVPGYERDGHVGDLFGTWRKLDEAMHGRTLTRLRRDLDRCAEARV